MQTDFQSKYTTTLNAEPSQVWNALTKPEIIKKYFFGTNLETKWEPNSPIVFRGDWEGQSYEDRGVVLSFVPEQSLSYSYLSSWAGLPDKPENYLFVEYRIKPVENGTELTITQSNYDQEKANHSAGSWEFIIEKMREILES